MMADAQSSVSEASADGDDLDIGLMVAGTVSNLLHATQRRKIGNRIGKDRLAFESEPDRQTGHILFGHSSVHVLLWKLRRKLRQYAEPEISRNQHDGAIVPGDIGKDPNEFIPQGFYPSNSASARWYSSPCGLR